MKTGILPPKYGLYVKIEQKCSQVPARFGEQGYGQHEYVYLGNKRRQEEYEEEEQQGYGQEGRYEQTGYGYGGNSQEVKTLITHWEIEHSRWVSVGTKVVVVQ